MDELLQEEKHHQIDQLMAENDKLITQFKVADIDIQARIQALGKRLGAERKFRDEFEAWLDIENKKHHDDYLKELSPSATASSVAYERCLFIYRQLKAQHLDSTETEAN